MNAPTKQKTIVMNIDKIKFNLPVDIVKRKDLVPNT